MSLTGGGYKRSTTFPDEVYITVSALEFRGVRLKLGYTMTNSDGTLVCEASSEHCFLDKDGKLVRINKEFPAFYETINTLLPRHKNEG